jgi:hypothetical protein
VNVITEMEHRKAALRNEMKLEKERHEKAMQGFKDEFRLAEERIQLASGDLDEDKILHAEHVIYVRGAYASAGAERGTAMSNAKAALLAGGGTLKDEYQGTKDYAHWHGQWQSHRYAYGPKHGSMIFEIGLTGEARKREGKLTDDEIEACLYYLTNLERIQSAKARAKEAA